MSLLDLASLVLAPTATKEGKVYSAIPDTGDGDMTFSRGSAATRVNSEGLIEKERGNRLRQSNNFNTSPYGPANATVTSGFEGYDGTNDAWKVASTTIGSETRIRQSQTFTTGEVISLSVYMKKGNVNFGIVRTYAITGGGRAWFDLENGTVATENSGINGSIEDVGNGWYRCSIWGVITTTGAVDIAPAPADGDYLADAVGEFIYIQDSMLNEGLVAQPYIETTTTAVYEGITDDVPRVDYSGGGCPSLLLEPSRTQLFPQSEYLGSGGWVISNGTLTTNYAISPEGVQNAAKINFTSGGEIVRTTSFTAGQDYTFSFYAKVESGTFDFTYGNMSYASISGTATTEWQRFEVTQTVPVATRYPKITATDTGDLLIYGMQCELGSYVSSYIPSYGTSTTRVQDSCSKTGISELIGQSEGTLFIDYETDNAENNGRIIAIGDGTTNNRILLRNQGNGTLLYVAASGSSTWSTTYYTPANTGRIKIALAYANNDGILYVNGSSVNSDTSVTVPACSNFYIGTSEYGGSESTNMLVKQAILFPTRLTNDQLQELTK